MAPRQGDHERSDVRQARDVVAFGQEVGRVLSDGRVVGRAEPFAKVFPSSRAVKRAVGPVGWVILEDIALDAYIDARGRLVSATNVRRIAANLGLNKDTVSRYLARLRDWGFVVHEELRGDSSGRYQAYRYVLQPSACVERFTTTPRPDDDGSAAVDVTGDDERDVRNPRAPAAGPAAGQGPAAGTAVVQSSPRPSSSDADETDTPTVSEDTGHGDTGTGGFGHKNQEEDSEKEKQPSGARTPVRDELVRRLVGLGLRPSTAAGLVDAHPPERVDEVLIAAARRDLRSPGGWVVQALRHGWAVTTPDTESQERVERREAVTRQDLDDRAAAAEQQRERGERWATAISAALDDDTLDLAIERVARPVPGLSQIPARVVRGQLVVWAAGVRRAHPHLSLAEALRRTLRGELDPPPLLAEGQLADPPPVSVPDHNVPGLADRIAAALRRRPPPARAVPTQRKEAS